MLRELNLFADLELYRFNDGSGNILFIAIDSATHVPNPLVVHPSAKGQLSFVARTWIQIPESSSCHLAAIRHLPKPVALRANLALGTLGK